MTIEPTLPPLPESIPTADETREVCFVIRGESRSCSSDQPAYLTYEDFTIVRRRVQELFGFKFEPCFRPRLFLKATAGQKGKLQEEFLCRFVRKFAGRERQMWELEQYDNSGARLLSSEQIEKYITDMGVFEKQGVSESLARVGARMGMLKAVFYHANRKRMMSLVDLVHGQTMAEIDKARSILNHEDNEVLADSSWFSEQNVSIIYETFCELDQNSTGRLSRAQFSSYKGAKMTRFFVERIFEEYGVVKNDEPVMDLDVFTTFILAWRDRSSPQAIRYLLRIYDIQKRGYLTSMNVFTFVKHVIADWVSLEPTAYYPQMIEDIINEIFDLVKPKSPGRITKEDLLVVENSGVVFGILGDVWEFWQHEHREDQPDSQQ